MYSTKLRIYGAVTVATVFITAAYIFGVFTGQITYLVPDLYEIRRLDPNHPVESGKPDPDGQPRPVIQESSVRNYHVIQSIPFDADTKGVNNDVTRVINMPVRGINTTQDMKTIMIWNPKFATPKDMKVCPQWAQRCSVTTDRGMATKADAVVLNTRNLGLMRDTEGFPYHTHSKQILVFYNVEPALGMGDVLILYDDVFNLTMTFRLDSDIPVRHVTLWPRPSSDPYVPPTAAQMAEKKKNIMWIISHCIKIGSNRWPYVLELSKYIDVDIYGGCGMSGCPYGGHGTNICMTKAEQHYKFYLALENSDCRDYVTEKLYKALARNVIPVVHGGLDYDRELPPKSVIKLVDFQSPKHLADYLHFLSENDEEYLKYFEWKRLYIPRDIGVARRSALCHLCQILHDDDYPYKTRLDVHNWWVTQSNTTTVEEQAKQLGLRIEETPTE